MYIYFYFYVYMFRDIKISPEVSPEAVYYHSATLYITVAPL